MADDHEVGEIILTLKPDLSLKSFVFITKDGPRPPLVDNLKAGPISVKKYPYLIKFEPWTFLAFGDQSGQILARYGKRADCSYYWI